MTKRDPVESARKAFAQVTGDLENAALVAADAQAAASVSAAREACDQLIARLGTGLSQLQRLRRRLE